MREVVKKARLASPCIIFFDEIDSLAPKRGSGGSDSGVSERVISQLLIEMDGVEKRDGITILAATNREDILDSALLRPGRFDIIINMPDPSFEDAMEIIQIHTRKMPLATGISFETVVRSMKNLTGANIENVCKKSAMLAIKRYMEVHKDNMPEDVKDLTINQADFIMAIEILRC